MIRLQELIITSIIFVLLAMSWIIYDQHKRLSQTEENLSRLIDSYSALVDVSDDNVEVYNGNFDMADARISELERKVNIISDYLTNYY